MVEAQSLRIVHCFRSPIGGIFRHVRDLAELHSAAGHEVGITRRKKVVARLLPPRDTGKVVFPDFGARARDIWGGGWQGASSDTLLEESRGDR